LGISGTEVTWWQGAACMTPAVTCFHTTSTKKQGGGKHYIP